MVREKGRHLSPQPAPATASAWARLLASCISPPHPPDPRAGQKGKRSPRGAPSAGARGPAAAGDPGEGGGCPRGHQSLELGWEGTDPTLLRGSCWPAGGATSPHGSVPGSPGRPLPAGGGFPRGRQYVETPPHSAGCPLPFRLARPWHPGGTGLPGPGWGSAFLSGDSPPPARSLQGRLSTALHWMPLGTADPCTSAQEKATPAPLSTAELLSRRTWAQRSHLPPGLLHLGWGQPCAHDAPGSGDSPVPVMSPTSSSGLELKLAAQCSVLLHHPMGRCLFREASGLTGPEKSLEFPLSEHGAPPAPGSSVYGGQAREDLGAPASRRGVLAHCPSSALPSHPPHPASLLQGLTQWVVGICAPGAHPGHSGPSELTCTCSTQLS